MSVLDLPRIVFSGDFQADVSTVNNDVRHYDNDAFESRFQDPQAGLRRNGWWNPTGSGAFRLLGCRVRGLVYADGTTIPEAGEPATGWSVTGAESEVSGKLVDLDPQWQMASEIWGLTVRLADPEGVTVLEADFEPAAFRDIFFGRQRGGVDVNRQSASAVYTSRLTGIRPGPAAGSRILDELMAASDDGTFAIRLTTFGYFTNAARSRFTLGRVVGAIGPGRRDQPRSFVLGRRFMPVDQTDMVTTEGVSFFDAVVSPEGDRIGIDLGNALPTVDAFGALAPISPFGPLRLAVLTTPDEPFVGPGIREGEVVAPTDVVDIGAIDYQSRQNWLDHTSGIVDLPVDAAARALIADHPLALVTRNEKKNDRVRVIIREGPGGISVRSDEIVHRCDAQTAGPVRAVSTIWATRWGVPSSMDVSVRVEDPKKGVGGTPPGDQDPTPPRSPVPVMGTPSAAVSVPGLVVTGSDGRAELAMALTPPGEPRGYLDGQIYVIRYEPANQPAPSVITQHAFDVVVVHLRDTFEVPAEITWDRHIAPIMSQYGNLYPIMSRRLVDLGNLTEVTRHAKILKLAFSRPIEDANHMPVTRELSEGKRRMILRWLDAVDDAERPPEDDHRSVLATPGPAPGTAAVDPEAAQPEEPDEHGDVGGKALAMRQTLALLDPRGDR